MPRFIAPALLPALVCGAIVSTVVARPRAPGTALRIACQSCLHQPAKVALAAAVPWEARDARDVVGRKMPVLSFERWINTPDGKPLDTGGKVTLYRWWTDGCEHCEKTLPAVEALRREYGPKGLRVVAVYHPKPPHAVKDEDVRGAAGAMGYDGPIALDLDWSELKKFYLDTGRRDFTSASFVVGADGVIRHAHPGPRFYPSDAPADATYDRDFRRLKAAVERLLEREP
jgi:thiol-disulfide isomerase/thioredoxin